MARFAGLFHAPKNSSWHDLRSAIPSVIRNGASRTAGPQQAARPSSSAKYLAEIRQQKHRWRPGSERKTADAAVPPSSTNEKGRAMATNEYEPRRLAGRCVDGFERDGGRVFHSVPALSQRAVCGATPGRRSAGWSEHKGERVTCPRCLRRLPMARIRALVFGGRADKAIADNDSASEWLRDLRTATKAAFCDAESQ